jgi:hypothetical protein
MPPMDNSMMDGMMAICMIASTLFALVILVAIIIQTVVQVKILGEVRRLQSTSASTDRNVAGPRQ